MQHDGLITISTGTSRKATHWPETTLLWSELVQKLSLPTRGSETLPEYKALSKGKQDDLKDVGGFVGGTLSGGRRKGNGVTGRCLIALDLDNIPAGATEDIKRRAAGLGVGCVIYSTRKHEPAAPRLRLLVQQDRVCSADEYEPAARILANMIGMAFFDPTTFQASRLMYWPSCSKDAEFVHWYNDAPPVSIDGLLALYGPADAWRDVTRWPQVPGEPEKQARRASVQKDPTEKPGVVGAFCRQYDIDSAIDMYLADRYAPDPMHPGRYTYLGGSTSGGAVVYDDGKFLYSHHATDPASGQLCNAFDLVRLHLFDGRDDDAKPETPSNRLPSYTAMCELAVADNQVATLLNQERYAAAVEEFSHLEAADPTVEAPENPDVNWMQLLELHPETGKPAKTTKNIFLILENDPLLKGKHAFDEFSNRGTVLGALPWSKQEERRDWGDPEDSGLRQYLEEVYGIVSPSKTADALQNQGRKHAFNDVQDYLSSLRWDGEKRLDTAMIDFFGADDNVYTREATRKFFVAAVARAFTPGTKYDQMLILVGPQGCGKSTFLERIGKRWFTDSLTTFEGKDAAEVIQGQWILEVGELAAMNRSELNSIKTFLTRTSDVFREAYGRRTARFPRRCVFAGTTNETEFLRDSTGDRRFLPIDLVPERATLDIFDDLTSAYVDQLWAEAVVRWQLGEQLFLRGEAHEIAKTKQKEHKESNAAEGIIRDFIEKEVPEGWDDFDIGQRRMYWQSDDLGGAKLHTIPRERVCALEIWCECFNGDIRYFDRRTAKEYNAILANIEGWERSKNGLRFGKVYGLQKGFRRVT